MRSLLRLLRLLDWLDLLDWLNLLNLLNLLALLTLLNLLHLLNLLKLLPLHLELKVSRNRTRRKNVYRHRLGIYRLALHIVSYRHQHRLHAVLCLHCNRHTLLLALDLVPISILLSWTSLLPHCWIRVDSHVPCQLIRPREPLCASWKRALVRFLTCVRSDVSCSVLESSKCLATYWTLVWTITFSFFFQSWVCHNNVAHKLFCAFCS